MHLEVFYLDVLGEHIGKPENIRKSLLLPTDFPVPSHWRATAINGCGHPLPPASMQEMSECPVGFVRDRGPKQLFAVICIKKQALCSESLTSILKIKNNYSFFYGFLKNNNKKIAFSYMKQKPAPNFSSLPPWTIVI